MDVKISVVIPAYNMQEYLEETVMSVVNQSYPAHEILIVNDGSKDRTSAIAHDLEKRYDTVKAFDKPNGGPCSARNYGFERMSGDYVVLLDSDDLLPEDTLEKYGKAALEFLPDVIVGKPILFDKYKKWNSKAYEEICIDEVTTFDDMPALVHCISPGPKLYNSHFLKKIKLDSSKVFI